MTDMDRQRKKLSDPIQLSIQKYLSINKQLYRYPVSDPIFENYIIIQRDSSR